jgi:integrase
VIEGDSEYFPVASKLDDSQFVEQRRLAAQEIARVFRIPPHMLGAPSADSMTHRAGFKTKREARKWFADTVAPRLDRGAPSAEITFDRFYDTFQARHGPTVSARTRATLAERLAPARRAFGDWTLAELEGAADDVARWRAGLTDTSRYRLTLALRQVLGAAVRWRYINRNPAIEAGSNPEPRSEELLPFSPEEVDALDAELGPVFGPLVTFAAETGLRTNEWVALERRDIDRPGLAVLVQRRYADGVLTPYPKTVGSRRRVPLSARALAALDRLPPRLDTPLVFPAARGGHIGLDGWRNAPLVSGAGGGGAPQARPLSTPP